MVLICKVFITSCRISIINGISHIPDLTARAADQLVKRRLAVNAAAILRGCVRDVAVQA